MLVIYNAKESLPPINIFISYIKYAMLFPVSKFALYDCDVPNLEMLPEFLTFRTANAASKICLINKLRKIAQPHECQATGIASSCEITRNQSDIIFIFKVWFASSECALDVDMRIVSKRTIIRQGIIHATPNSVRPKYWYWMPTVPQHKFVRAQHVKWRCCIRKLVIDCAGVS